MRHGTGITPCLHKPPTIHCPSIDTESIHPIWLWKNTHHHRENSVTPKHTKWSKPVTPFPASSSPLAPRTRRSISVMSLPLGRGSLSVPHSSSSLLPPLPSQSPLSSFLAPPFPNPSPQPNHPRTTPLPLQALFPLISTFNNLHSLASALLTQARCSRRFLPNLLRRACAWIPDVLQDKERWQSLRRQRQRCFRDERLGQAARPGQELGSTARSIPPPFIFYSPPFFLSTFYLRACPFPKPSGNIICKPCCTTMHGSKTCSSCRVCSNILQFCSSLFLTIYNISLS